MVRTDLRHTGWWILGGVGLVALVAYICLVPGDDVPRIQFSDKLGHFLMFLVPALWFGGIFAPRRSLWLGLALLAYAGLTELAQGWLDWGRQAEWLDFAADAAGVSLGLLLALTPLGRWALWLESLPRRLST